MPSLKVNGIVVRYSNYRESDRIVTLFTRELGLISCAARGCRNAKSSLLHASELFTYGEFVLFKTKDKYTLDSCTITDAFYPLREDISKLSAASYMVSVVNEGAQEGLISEKLLSLLLYALSFTAYSDANALDMAICFTLKALHELGYSPAITHCASCTRDIRSDEKLYFSAASGGAVCLNCAKSDAMEVSALSLEAIRRMLLLNDDETGKVKLPQRVRKELKFAVNSYAERIFEKKLKAFSMLEEAET